MLWFSCNILNSERIPKQPLPLPDTQSVFCGLDDWTDPRAGLRMTVSRQNTDSSGRVHLTSPVPTNMMSLCLLFDLLNKGAGEQKRSRLWRMRKISLLKRVCVPGRPTEPNEHPSGYKQACMSITSTFAGIRCWAGARLSNSSRMPLVLSLCASQARLFC